MFKDVRAADITHVVGLFYEYSMYYLLNEWEGQTKKYLAPGQDVRTRAGAQRGLVSHTNLFRGARISCEVYLNEFTAAKYKHSEKFTIKSALFHSIQRKCKSDFLSGTQGRSFLSDS